MRIRDGERGRQGRRLADHWRGSSVFGVSPRVNYALRAATGVTAVDIMVDYSLIPWSQIFTGERTRNIAYHLVNRSHQKQTQSSRRRSCVGLATCQRFLAASLTGWILAISSNRDTVCRNSRPGRYIKRGERKTSDKSARAAFSSLSDRHGWEPPQHSRQGHPFELDRAHRKHAVCRGDFD